MVKLGGRDLSEGWNAEINRASDTGGSPVTDHREATMAVWLFLDLGAQVALADLMPLVQDERAAEEIEQDPQGAPSWMIPLDIDRMGELIQGGNYLNVEIDSGSQKYQILIDLTDSF
jgi:hypothetical protein